MSVFIMKSKESKKSGMSDSFIIGVIALVFLLIGYQTALLVHRAAVTMIVANRDTPDTVYVDREENSHPVTVVSEHVPRAQAVRKNVARRRVESFRFNPNTVSVEDLCRLGFSLKQAESIDNYRKKGGVFRRKSDFARSFVVADSVYHRLEEFIEIPLVDLNVADSAAFDSLPGIGGWFASKMILHRDALGGYSYKEQLLDIYRFDKEKFDALSDLVIVNEPYRYPLWDLPADSLSRHPYIDSYDVAKAIVLFRDHNSPEDWTVDNLARSGVISADAAVRLSGCVQ